jgi:hypothetical protein
MRRRKGKKKGFKLFKGIKKGFENLGKGIKRKVNKVSSDIANPFKKFGSDVNRTTKNISTKINKVSKDFENTLDRAGFKNPVMSKAELREFMKKNKGRTKAGLLLQAIGTGAKRGFQNVQAPAKLITQNDPLRNTKLGKAGFSPISLAGEIAFAIPSSIGTIGRSLVDKEVRNKIRKGDSEAILDLAFSPLALIPGGSAAGGSAKEGAKAGAKAGTKAVAKSTANKLAKKTLTTTALRSANAVKQLGKMGIRATPSLLKN